MNRKYYREDTDVLVSAIRLLLPFASLEEDGLNLPPSYMTGHHRILTIGATWRSW
jgi:hypothetical protein